MMHIKLYGVVVGHKFVNPSNIAKAGFQMILVHYYNNNIFQTRGAEMTFLLDNLINY